MILSSTFLPSNVKECSSYIIIKGPTPLSLPFFSPFFLLSLLLFFCFPSLPLFLSPSLTLYITKTKTASNNNPARTAKMITHTGTGMGAGWMPQVTFVVTCGGEKSSWVLKIVHWVIQQISEYILHFKLMLLTLSSSISYHYTSGINSIYTLETLNFMLTSDCLWNDFLNNLTTHFMMHWFHFNPQIKDL